MKVAVSKIKWCIEQEDVEETVIFNHEPTQEDIEREIEVIKESLPTEVVMEVEDEDEIADKLTDEYGWLVESFEYDWREK